MVAKTIKRGLILAVVVPMAAAGVRKASQVVEKRRGSSRLTRAMRGVADMVSRNSKRGRRWQFGR
jgi:hypothetical protein